MKLSWKGYWHPTPKGIRKIADSLLAGATLAATYSFTTDHQTVGLVVMIVSVVAKIVSNFLTDEAPPAGE